MPRRSILRSPGILLATALSATVACQNWDMLQPEESDAAGRSFTPLRDTTGMPGTDAGGGTQPLTLEIAQQRMRDVLEARGEERLTRIESFLEDYPQATGIVDLHRLAGEVLLARGDAEAAADALDRAMALSSRDVLGLPLDPALPYQLGMAKVMAGDSATGIDWLVRTTLLEESSRLDQALRWVYNEVAEAAGGGGFAEWRRREIERRLVRAPEFALPGLREPSIDLTGTLAQATLINFWSPT